MITDDDVEKLKKHFITRSDLDSSFEKIRTEIRDSKNEILDGLDKISGELKKLKFKVKKKNPRVGFF